MHDTEPPQPPLFSRAKRAHAHENLDGHHNSRQHLAALQFDLLVSFDDDQQAREALLALRRHHFGPDQAVLLARGPLAQDELELAAEDLRAESYLALTVIVTTEIMLGALVGAVIGWLVGLFHFAPEVGPIWQPILLFGGLGLLCGCIVGLVELRRWRVQHLPPPGQAAIAVRLSGPGAPARLARAQAVLEQFGGQHDSA